MFVHTSFMRSEPRLRLKVRRQRLQALAHVLVATCLLVAIMAREGRPLRTVAPPDY
jgi:hypothetical protein